MTDDDLTAYLTMLGRTPDKPNATSLFVLLERKHVAHAARLLTRSSADE